MKLKCKFVMPLFFLLSCSGPEIKNNSTAETDLLPCSPESQAGLFPDIKGMVTFVTGQDGGGNAEAASIVYSLEWPSLALKPVVVRDSSSNDPVLFKDTDGTRVFVERFNKSASRLTRLSRDTFSPLGESATFAENLNSIHKLADNKYLTGSWNFGQINMFVRNGDKEFDNVTMKDPLKDKIEQDKHSATLLIDGTTQYIISSGFSLSRFDASQARIFKLNSEADKVETAQDIPDCLNAADGFIYQSSNHEAYLSCNPQYSGTSAGAKNPLLYLSIKNGVIETKEISPGADANVQMRKVGGVNSDASEAFITSKSTNKDPDGWMGKIVSSMWFNRSTSKSTSSLPLARDVVIIPGTTQMLYNCVVSSATQRCIPNMFALLPEAKRAEPQTACYFTADYKYDFKSFEKKIF